MVMVWHLLRESYLCPRTTQRWVTETWGFNLRSKSMQYIQHWWWNTKKLHLFMWHHSCRPDWWKMTVVLSFEKYIVSNSVHWSVCFHFYGITSLKFLGLFPMSASIYWVIHCNTVNRTNRTGNTLIAGSASAWFIKSIWEQWVLYY